MTENSNMALYKINNRVYSKFLDDQTGSVIYKVYQIAKKDGSTIYLAKNYRKGSNIMFGGGIDAFAIDKNLISMKIFPNFDYDSNRFEKNKFSSSIGYYFDLKTCSDKLKETKVPNIKFLKDNKTVTIPSKDNLSDCFSLTRNYTLTFDGNKFQLNK